MSKQDQLHEKIINARNELHEFVERHTTDDGSLKLSYDKTMQYIRLQNELTNATEELAKFVKSTYTDEQNIVNNALDNIIRNRSILINELNEVTKSSETGYTISPVLSTSEEIVKYRKIVNNWCDEQELFVSTLRTFPDESEKISDVVENALFQGNLLYDDEVFQKSLHTIFDNSEHVVIEVSTLSKNKSNVKACKVMLSTDMMTKLGAMSNLAFSEIVRRGLQQVMIEHATATQQK